jgi:hypothetical protein
MLFFPLPIKNDTTVLASIEVGFSLSLGGFIDFAVAI